MFRFAALLLLMFSVSACVAQTILKGRITGEKDEGLPFVTVELFRATDSALLKTAVSDSEGRYLIPTEIFQQSYLAITKADYRPGILEISDTASEPRNIRLQKNARRLDGITVTARKALVERRADRTIFNVENSATSAGGDAYEALKRAPGVVVNNDVISLAGKSSVTVMINDRLQQLTGEELVSLLRSIPADNLARIEVITTPPARYDAAGNSGIINIITKKTRQNGLNGNVAAGFQKRTKGAAFGNGNFNYRRNGWNVYGSSNEYSSRQVPDALVTTRLVAQQWAQSNYSERLDIFGRSQLGVDYNIRPDLVMGLLYTNGWGGWGWDNTENIATRIANKATGSLDSLLRTSATSTDRGHRNVGNLNLDWKLDTSGRRLSIDLDYFHRTGAKVRDFRTAHYLADGAATGYNSDNHTTGYQRIEIKSGKVDVEWPTKAADLSFGGKGSFIHNVSDNNFQYLSGGHYETDAGKTSAFDYKENTQALYLSGKRTFGKWNTQLGLRGEYTQTAAYSPTLGQTTNNEYFNVFPTAYLQYSANDVHAFNLNFSRRIERPSFWLLNPFRTYSTSTSYETGNPFLQPSYSSNLELAYSLHSKYAVTLFSQQIRRYFSRVSQVDSNTGSVAFTQANTGSIDNYGITLSASYDPFSWWEGSLEINSAYSRFSSPFYGKDFSFAKPTVFLETSNSFTLNKARTLVFGVDAWYQADNQDDFDLEYASARIDVAMKILCFQKRLSINVSVQDLFRTDISRATNLYNGTARYRYDDEQSLRVAVAWKFGNSGLKEKRERKADADAGRAQ